MTTMISNCRIIFIVIHVLLACGLPASCDLGFKVQLNSAGQFVDPQGRVRLFRGFNAVEKQPPWFPQSVMNLTRLKLYKEWGFNVVRFGTMWSGVMPGPGSFDPNYLSTVGKIVDLLADNGMYTLLDMHQDIISSKFQAYDGVPLWLINKFPAVPDKFKYPWPLAKPPVGVSWFEGYLTYAVGDAFQNLYANTSGALDYWQQFWTKVASEFGGRNSVIGYELINEPWAGNIYTNPLRIVPGYAGKYNLLPNYDHLTKAIRVVDQSTLIFYEPVTWGVYASGVLDGTGFERTPGGPSEAARSVLSFHYYCWLLAVADPTTPYPHWERLICDDILLRDVFSSVRGAVRRTGGGSFFTEFGTCFPDNSSQSIDTVECREVMRQADQNLVSWTYWDSMFFNETTGQPIETQVRAFARSYPRATAGQPLALQFDVDTGVLQFQYALNISVTAPTEIFLPTTVHYPNGFDADIKPEMVTKFEPSTNILSISPPAWRMTLDAAVISVTISPK